MAEKTERLQIPIEPELKRTLEQECDKTGTPVAEYVRRAIAEKLRGGTK